MQPRIVRKRRRGAAGISIKMIQASRMPSLPGICRRAPRDSRRTRLRACYTVETADERSSAETASAARQYSGALGGVALCQVAVTLTLATSRGHALIGRKLYLPGTRGRRGAPGSRPGYPRR